MPMPAPLNYALRHLRYHLIETSWGTKVKPSNMMGPNYSIVYHVLQMCLQMAIIWP